jgi:NitT/TauT family transport system substrate-binding protein
MSPKIKFAIAGIILTIVVILSLSPNVETQNVLQSTTGSVDTIKIGYFPNLNHAQAVIGIANGDYQRYLGNVKIEPYVFNAGPTEIESLFAGSLDVAYVGPSPAINGYLKTEGKGLRIISGASSGGAVFVVRADSGIQTVNDLGGKKFSSPQLGNTQDVSLRTFLQKNGYKTTENGGNIQVVPASNPDIFTMIEKKEIDGAWVPEPWGAKLVHETNAKIFVDERDLWQDGKFSTAVIVVRTDYLQAHPDVIRKLLEAHVAETLWINSNKNDSIAIFNEQSEKLTGKTIPQDELGDAFSRVNLTYDPIKESIYKSADEAFNLGFLGTKKPDLSNLLDLRLLNEVLSDKKLNPIQ